MKTRLYTPDRGRSLWKLTAKRGSWHMKLVHLTEYWPPEYHLKLRNLRYAAHPSRDAFLKQAMEKRLKRGDEIGGFKLATKQSVPRDMKQYL